MQLYEKAVFNDWFNVGPSMHHLSKAKEFNVKCKILHRNTGIYVDKYALKLEGSNEDIRSFISYLKYVGFNIKNF